MKNIKIFAILAMVLVSLNGLAQAKKTNKKANVSGLVASNLLSQVQSLIANKNYVQASTKLYQLTRSPGIKEAEKIQVHYLLGLSLAELNLDQMAALQFVEVVRKGQSKYLKAALDRLTLSADRLGDDTLINYSLKKINPKEFPGSKIDMLYYRTGDIEYLKGNLDVAEENFRKVASKSLYYDKAQYQLATLLMENKKPEESLPLLKRGYQKAKTKNDKQIMIMAMARAYYQMEEWEKAIAYYKKIPRDSVYWSETLFELTWAQLRAAKFRSVLSTLQTVHSPFYEEDYLPESLLVRGIVYLYICKFDELEKTMEAFDKVYGKDFYNKMERFYENAPKSSLLYAQELLKAYEFSKIDPSIRKSNPNFDLPYPILRSLLQEGDIRRVITYQEKVKKEMEQVNKNKTLSSSSLYSYAQRMLKKRLISSEKILSNVARVHLKNKMEQWKSFDEQAGFIKYEMTNGKKEQLKKKIAGKDIGVSGLDDKRSRDFYIENGYEYWPVESEVWIDELGNYHYVGQQSCQ